VSVERRRRRHDDSDHSSHNDEAEHVVRPWRGQRREVFGNHTPRRDKMWRKIIIPKFNGANDPEAYLAWEMKLDQIFNSYDYEDDDKVLMASLEFEGYAMNWWNQITVDIARRRRLPISTWEQLKVAMKERFVPPYYKKEIFNKLQRLTQGNKSVEEYVQEMEVTLMKAEVEETHMATMARFLNGLNREIQDVVEMHHYETLEDLIHQATRVEQQLKRRSAYRKSSTSWRDKEKYKKEGATSTIPKSKEKESSNGKITSQASNDDSSRSSAIKCFKCLGRGHIPAKCPNRRTLMLLANGEYINEHFVGESSESSSSDEEEKECEVPPLEGDLLMVRRLLGSMNKEEDETQRRNIFHSRCMVMRKVCSLIIDGGSCTNVASKRLVEKLGLVTSIHPSPYALQWLSEDGELVIDKQVNIAFSIGKYVDEVVCDVVPMEASHLLLGRPW